MSVYMHNCGDVRAAQNHPAGPMLAPNGASENDGIEFS